MDMTHLLRLQPTLEAIAEEFSLSGWPCQVHIRTENASYRNVRLFTGQTELHPDILYALRPEEIRFPVNDYDYACTTPIQGNANHIICPSLSPEALLDTLMALFDRCHHWENLIDQLTYRGAGLQELCELGAELLENPVCIHDDWFIMIGMSQEASQIMAPEYLISSTVGFVPRVIVDDFKYDSDYLETYAHPNAQIWYSSGIGPNSLYVNLWDGTIYRGRLLVIEHNRPFRKSDFLLAEVLTQRAISLLQRKLPGVQAFYRSMDDILFELLAGNPTDPTELAHLLNNLSWDKSHRYLCVRLKSQQTNPNTVMEHMLHSDLFHSFPDSYIMFTGQEQCLTLNLSKTGLSLQQIRHQLSPLCRDYCLYAGLSSPISGIGELNLAYVQAGVALDQAFQLRSEKWIIPFGDCMLEHIFNSLHSPLPLSHLVSPELLALIQHDQEKGTQYFKTLRTYLLLERDIPKTAEALIIHRTTLLYRLKKIQALIPSNLSDPWQRLQLMLSLWILEKEQQPAP